jgi:hypothetical protein
MLCGGQGIAHCRRKQGGTAVAADKNKEGVTYTADKAMDASQLQVDTSKAKAATAKEHEAATTKEHASALAVSTCNCDASIALSAVYVTRSLFLSAVTAAPPCFCLQGPRPCPPHCIAHPREPP